MVSTCQSSGGRYGQDLQVPLASPEFAGVKEGRSYNLHAALVAELVGVFREGYYGGKVLLVGKLAPLEVGGRERRNGKGGECWLRS